MKFDLMDNFNRLFRVIEAEWTDRGFDGDFNFEICLADMFDTDSEDNPLGQTDFDAKRIYIHHDQTPTQMLDIITHEAAHVIAGFAASHNETWKMVYKSIFDKYQELSRKELGEEDKIIY